MYFVRCLITTTVVSSVSQHRPQAGHQVGPNPDHDLPREKIAVTALASGTSTGYRFPTLLSQSSNWCNEQHFQNGKTANMVQSSKSKDLSMQKVLKRN